MTSVSLYLYAGDFVDALQRYEDKSDQVYQSHDEAARLIHDFVDLGYELSIYSFVTPTAGEARPLDGVRIVSLGAADWSASGLLRTAIESDRSDAILVHFANHELLRALEKGNARAMVMMANSYNRTGVRALWQRRQIVKLLNSDRFEWVSNHCNPSTQQLADMGVRKDKLVAWDVPHPFSPGEFPAKSLRTSDSAEIVYVGSIVEDKGVGDLIRAIAILNRQGIQVKCTLAGLGDLDGMRSLGAELGVTHSLRFVGLIGNKQAFKYMLESDLVAVPSRTNYTEGFPLTMFEAIASRTPIVCSDHPMFRPVMIDGQTASVFRAGEPVALAEAISRTLRDPVLYGALSAMAPTTWLSLKGPADWRELILHWASDPHPSTWIRERAFLQGDGPGR